MSRKFNLLLCHFLYFFQRRFTPLVSCSPLKLVFFNRLLRTVEIGLRYY